MEAFVEKGVNNIENESNYENITILWRDSFIKQ